MNKERLKRFFEEEDNIFDEIDSKIIHLLVSRGINLKSERNKIVKLRKALLKEVKKK